MSPYARLCTASDRAYEHSRPTYSTRCCRLWHILVPMAPAVCGTFRHSNLKSATGSIVRIVERILKVMKLLHRMLSTPVLFIGWYKMARAMYITVFFVDQNNLIHVAFHVDWQTNKQTDRQTRRHTLGCLCFRHSDCATLLFLNKNIILHSSSHRLLSCERELQPINL